MPTLQFVHAPEPALAYVPGGHTEAVADVDPAGHAYPAAQFPVQAAEANPAKAPYKPAGHGAVQVLVVKPGVEPYVPVGQGEHTPAPTSLNFPGAHTVTVELVLPTGQAYPAVQLPVQTGDVTPDTWPNRPDGH